MPEADSQAESVVQRLAVILEVELRHRTWVLDTDRWPESWLRRVC